MRAREVDLRFLSLEGPEQVVKHIHAHWRFLRANRAGKRNARRVVLISLVDLPYEILQRMSTPRRI